MAFNTVLDDILRNRSHIRVLRALHQLPRGLRASGRELARRAGTSHPTALQALAILVDTGIVDVSRGPVADSYGLNPDHLLADAIADLFEWEARMGDDLRRFVRTWLEPLSDKVKRATLFGSAVWGGSSPTSDIDLAVTCAPADLEAVEEALDDLSVALARRFGHHLSPLISTSAAKPVGGVWKRIETEGIHLIGSEDSVMS